MKFTNTECETLLFNAGYTTYVQNSKLLSLRNEKYYHYIPFCRYEVFMYLISKYGRNRDFLDVGCGIGDKLYLANLLKRCKSITGIEVVSDYVSIARYLLDRNEVGRSIDIIHEDALNFDYSKYDLIYMYHPIKDRELYQKLVSRIKETSPEDGILIEVMHQGEICATGGMVFKKINGKFSPLKIKPF